MSHPATIGEVLFGLCFGIAVVAILGIIAARESKRR